MKGDSDRSIDHVMIECGGGTALSVYHRVGISAQPPLILIPGLGMPAAMWFSIVDHLPTDRPLAIVEPRGSGKSGYSGEELSGDLFAKDILRVLENFGWGSTHLCGVSMGGMVIQEFALRFASMVRSLALVSTYARPGAWGDLVWQLRLSLLGSTNPRDQKLAAALFLTGPQTVETDPTSVESLFALWEKLPAVTDAYREQMNFCRRHNVLEDLRELSVPSLVISGGQDLLCTPGAGSELAKALNAQFVVSPQGTHLLTGDAPAWVAQLVQGHIERVDSALPRK